MIGLGIEGNVLFTATDQRTGRVRTRKAKNTVRGVAGTWARKALWNNTNRGFYYDDDARCYLYNSSRVVQSGNTHLISSSAITTGRIGNLNTVTERTNSGASMTYRWRFQLNTAYTIARAYWLIPSGVPSNNIHVLAYVDPSGGESVTASETLDVEWTFTFSGTDIDGLSRIAQRLSGGLSSETWDGFSLRWSGEGSDGTPLGGQSQTGAISTSATIRENNCYMDFAASGTYTGTNNIDVSEVQLVNGTGSNATVMAHLDKTVTIGNGSTFSGTATFGGLRH